MKITWTTPRLPPGELFVPLADDPAVHVPRRWAFAASNEDADPLPDLSIEMEVRDGEVRVAAVTVRARDDGRGVLVSDLRAVLLDEWVKAAVEAVAQRFEPSADGEDVTVIRSAPDLSAANPAVRAYLRSKGRKPRSQKRQQLAEAARIYRENLDDRPIEKVAARFGIKHRTAQQWIKEARDPAYGFLGEHTEHGRATP